MQYAPTLARFDLAMAQIKNFQVMPLPVTDTELNALQDSLLDTSGNVPLHNRFRALFTLKALKSDQAVKIISKGFDDPSALLKHELAYCLGQMKNSSAIPALESVLKNSTEDPMVRHEVLVQYTVFTSTQTARDRLLKPSELSLQLTQYQL